MAKKSVEVFFVSPKNLDQIKRGVGQTKKEALGDAIFQVDMYGYNLVNHIVAAAPKNEGNFADGFDHRVTKTGPNAGSLTVKWTPKNRPEGLLDWITFGTGLYGPFKKRIKPVTAPFLQWQDKYGGWHRAKSTRGMKKNKFLQRAWTETKDARKRLEKVIGQMIFIKMFGRSPRA